MPTNNKSIQILRGTTTSGGESNVDRTVLETGQPFYDKRTNTLRIGHGNETINNTAPITVDDGAITTIKLHTGAVTTDKLHDASNDESNRTGITTAKIENSAITGSKIANESISDSKVAPDADINGTKFKDNSISGSKLHDADGSSGITTDKVEDNAITTPKILDNTITPEKLQATGDFNAHSFSSNDDNTKEYANYEADRIVFKSTAKDSDGQVTLVPSIAVGQTVMLGLPSVDGTLATAEEIESGEIVAKTAQNATNATNAEKTDFSNAEWISVASGNTATFVNGGTYQITNPTVANAKTYMSNIIYVPKHIETEIKFILGEYPSLTNDKQFWGITEYHLILDTNFQAHVIRKSKPAGHDPYTDDLAFEYRRIR